MRELKPCPFCGKDIVKRSEEYIGNSVISLECGCKTCFAEFRITVPYLVGAGFHGEDVYEVVEDAISIWNRRDNKP